MNYTGKIRKDIKSGKNLKEVSRKVFMSYPSVAFTGDRDLEYKIREAVCSQFHLPFSSILFTGSSQTGFSFFKKTTFTEGVSDLDVSVVCLDLYNQFLEDAHNTTEGFSNLSPFPNYKGKRTDKQFIQNFQKGYINPYFMPKSQLKNEWLDFFRSLSNENHTKFKDITGSIYASEYFFERKQLECIEEFANNINSYDTLSSKI